MLISSYSSQSTLYTGLLLSGLIPQLFGASSVRLPFVNEKAYLESYLNFVKVLFRSSRTNGRFPTRLAAKERTAVEAI